MSDRDGPDAASDRPLQAVDPVLTPRQRTILDVIRASVTSRGYPPSIREIGDAVGLTSTSSVAHQLRTLERKGYRVARIDVGRDIATVLTGLKPDVALKRRRNKNSAPPSWRREDRFRRSTFRQARSNYSLSEIWRS